MVLFLIIFGIGWTFIIFFPCPNLSVPVFPLISAVSLIVSDWNAHWLPLSEIWKFIKIMVVGPGGGVSQNHPATSGGQEYSWVPGFWAQVGIAPSLASNSLLYWRPLSPCDGNVTTEALHFTAVATSKRPTWHSLWFKPRKDPKEVFWLISPVILDWHRSRLICLGNCLEVASFARTQDSKPWPHLGNKFVCPILGYRISSASWFLG